MDNDSRKWFILSVGSLGVFMSTLDASIVNIALPKITAYYQAPLANVEWVVMVYLLLISSLLLTYGRIGDMYGHKPVYIIGFSTFTLGSLFCSLSPNLGSLIVSRALQAIGAGMTMAVVQALIANAFPATERGRAIGINALVVSLGTAVGPTLGGILVGSFGWQSIFMINIPIGIFGTIWAWYVLPAKRGVPQNFDIGGAATLFIALCTFLLGMSHGNEWGWSSPLVLGLFVVAVVFAALFVWTENRTPAPMVRLELFRNRFFVASNVAAMLNYLCQYAVIFLLPFYLNTILKLPTNQAGMLMSVFPLAMMFMGPISGSLTDRGVRPQLLSSAGMAIIAVGVLVLSSLAMTGSLIFIMLGMAMAGIGTGFFVAPNNNAIMSSVPKGQTGIGSGMIATMRNLGQVLGIAVSGAVFASRSHVYQATLQAAGQQAQTIATQSFILAQRDAYLVAAGVAVLGMLMSLARGKASVATLVERSKSM